MVGQVRSWITRLSQILLNTEYTDVPGQVERLWVASLGETHRLSLVADPLLGNASDSSSEHHWLRLKGFGVWYFAHQPVETCAKILPFEIVQDCLMISNCDYQPFIPFSSLLLSQGIINVLMLSCGYTERCLTGHYTLPVAISRWH